MSGLDYYEKYEVKAEELYDAGKYTEAIAFLEPAYEEFPEHYFDITFYVLLCYRESKQYDKCLEVIKQSVEAGYFSTYQWTGWDPIREIEGSDTILAENERLKAEAQKHTTMKYEVHLPQGYTAEKNWPLFLSMHCDGAAIGNIESHRQHWKPDVMLERGFVVVYVQSSQPISSIGYEWSADAERRRNDIRDCYEEVVAAYAVDAGVVILSGFSGGALASIDVALSGILPVKGFIALGPDKPEEFSTEICEKARRRGVRGVIMEGEEIADSPELQEIEAVFKEAGFQYEIYINEGIGHWYPDDLDEKLDQAITFIMGG